MRDGLCAQMRGNVNLQRQMHVFRDGWRAYAWNRFVACVRHELRDLHDVRKRDWDRIRRFMQNPACRRIGLSTVVSPAWFGETVDDASDGCFWCGCLGSWSHVAWFSPRSEFIAARPVVLPPSSEEVWVGRPGRKVVRSCYLAGNAASFLPVGSLQGPFSSRLGSDLSGTPAPDIFSIGHIRLE